MAKRKKLILDALICESCGRIFEPNRAWQKYCNADCKAMMFFRRKVATRDALDVLNIEAKKGPTQFQEAEFERRKNLRIEREEEERKFKADSLSHKAGLFPAPAEVNTVQEEPTALEALGYGPQREKSHALESTDRQATDTTGEGGNKEGEKEPRDSSKD